MVRQFYGKKSRQEIQDFVKFWKAEGIDFNHFNRMVKGDVHAGFIEWSDWGYSKYFWWNGDSPRYASISDLLPKSPLQSSPLQSSPLQSSPLQSSPQTDLWQRVLSAVKMPSVKALFSQQARLIKIEGSRALVGVNERLIRLCISKVSPLEDAFTQVTGYPTTVELVPVGCLLLH